MPKVLTRIIEGLQDLDDDVRAVAAASLVPVVESLVYLQTHKVNLNIFAFFSHQGCLHLGCRVLGKHWVLFSPSSSVLLMTHSPLMYVILITYYPWEEWIYFLFVYRIYRELPWEENKHFFILPLVFRRMRFLVFLIFGFWLLVFKSGLIFWSACFKVWFSFVFSEPEHVYLKVQQELF